MRVAGAHVRVSDHRYLTGFAVLENRDVVDVLSLPAPSGSDEGRQLEELHTITADLLAKFAPQQLAISVTATQRQADRAIAQRGAGVLMAAAGAAGVGVKLWSGSGLWSPAGLTRNAAHQESVEALCRKLSGKPTDTTEVAYAAAVALASLKRLGG